MSVTYAVFSAMPEELNYFRHIFEHAHCEQVQIDTFSFPVYNYKNTKIILAACGIGTTFAAAALTCIYFKFRPSAVLFSGVAGGVDVRLAIGDVVIAENAFEAEIQGLTKLLTNTPFETCLTHPLNNVVFGNSYSADKNLLDVARNSCGDNVYFGNAVTSNQFPAPAELFQKIKRLQPLSIDMETSAFYQVAWLYNIPMLAIRGISNLLDTNGVDDNVHLSNVSGAALAAGRVTLSVLNKLIESEKSVISSEVEQLIKKFSLSPHPEGGYYARHFTSGLSVQVAGDQRYKSHLRKAGSSIYYLLNRSDYSAFHRLKSDEIWHFYMGSTIKIYLLDNSGNLSTYLLGNAANCSSVEFQLAIPADKWFAAEVLDKDAFAFVGCTVAPGFEFEDFELADRENLSTRFPAHAGLINRFTRIVL